jgi:hypothetical protein
MMNTAWVCARSNKYFVEYLNLDYAKLEPKLDDLSIYYDTRGSSLRSLSLIQACHLFYVRLYNYSCLVDNGHGGTEYSMLVLDSENE